MRLRILVTGSAGHLGEALMRTLQDLHHEAIDLDIKPSRFTQLAGSIADRGFVEAGRNSSTRTSPAL